MKQQVFSAIALLVIPLQLGMDVLTTARPPSTPIETVMAWAMVFLLDVTTVLALINLLQAVFENE